MNWCLVTSWLTTALLLLFSIVATGPKTYRVAIVFLAPLLWGVYALRRRLHIHPATFAVFAAAILFHDLGAFGAYGKFFYGLEFDTYVHFFFGIAGGLVLARSLRYNLNLHGWQLWVGTVLMILGIAAIHEIIEALSTMILGPEKGMFKVNDPDKFDTQKDLMNGGLGSMVAMIIYSLAHKFNLKRQTESFVDLGRAREAT